MQEKRDRKKSARFHDHKKRKQTTTTLFFIYHKTNIMNEENEMNSNVVNNDAQHRVLALYKFVNIDSDKVPILKEEIESKLRSFKARGTILLACEGINGTICYPESLALSNKGKDTSMGSENNDSVLEYFQKHEIFSGLRTRISFASSPIFHRLKIKVKKEIVTMTGEDDEDEIENINERLVPKENTEESVINDEGNHITDDEEANPKNKKPKKDKLIIDPTKVVGTYVKPGKEWDDLLMDPDVVVIDTRNKYEIEIGTFENAISPNTDNFRYV